MFGKKKEIGKISQSFSKLNKEWFEVRKEIEKAIKNNNLIDSILVKYHNKTLEYITFIEGNRKELIEENPRQSDLSLDKAINEFKIHLDWSSKEMLIREKVSKLEE